MPEDNEKQNLGECYTNQYQKNVSSMFEESKYCSDVMKKHSIK